MFQDKACEAVDMSEIGPTSLDGKKSQSVKLEKFREEAQYEKERVSKFFFHFSCSKSMSV